MTSPATLPVPIVGINVDRYTIGQIGAAARTLGDDTLLARVVEGSEHAIETVRRFLVGDFEYPAQRPESSEGHSPFAV